MLLLATIPPHPYPSPGGGPLAVLRTPSVTPPAPRTVVWRSYDEVFDLALDGGSVLAATNGGLLRDGRPVPSPSGLRAIVGLRPLSVRRADGVVVGLQPGGFPMTAPERTRDLDHGLALDPGDPWPGPVPPPAHAYAALRLGADLLAGTSEGLYRFSGGRWTRQILPGDLPLARPNGIAEAQGTYVIGGLGGLYVGHPGMWRKATDAAIRQVASVGGEIWAVHGDGALDKVDPVGDRLYPDVLAGNARRPWTSCVGGDGRRALFGGQGGWAEQGTGARFPKELRGDVVTVTTGRLDVRFVGSQKAGLFRFRFRGAEVRRWNPGNGLKDPWVTALLPTPQGLVVGTARGGLFRLFGERLSPLAGPTQRVAALALWHGRLVVGGMDGAWIASGAGWRDLGTGGEETTSVTPLKGRLAVTTAAGAFFLP